ncbi:MAG TPA: ABC transporter substrate-binding protein [Saprospiraceae bacterium]|nr:ABC transporter substrate-binding protein [Saprospiraceae bacterium]
MKNQLLLKFTGNIVSAFICLLFIGSLLFINACSDSGDDAERTLEIGVLAPLTGSIASAGESGVAAISLALDDVNQYLENSGSQLKVSIDIRDDQTDTTAALQRLKEFHDKGIRFVIGPYTSANAAAILDYANQNEMIMLSPSSVATTLSIADDNLFRLIPDDQSQAEAIAALFTHDNIDHIIPIVRSDVWGDGLINNVSQLMTQQGKTLITPIRYDPSNINTAAIISEVTLAINQTLQQVPAARTAVYLLSFAEGTSILSAASATPEASLVRWYGSSAYATNASLILDSDASVFAYQQSLRCPIFAPDAAAKDLWQPIVDKLVSQLGRAPESYALTSYDAVWLMALAYKDSSDPDDLASFKTSLTQTAGIFYGITGRTAFNAAGDRKFATLGLLGLSFDNNMYSWKEYGNYSNSSGQLVIY